MSDSFVTSRIVALLSCSLHEILQAGTLEWVAISFSRRSPALQADSLPAEPPGKPRKMIRASDKTF